MNNDRAIDPQQPPSAWTQIAMQTKAAFERNTGRPFDAWLIGDVAVDPSGINGGGDRVAWGYARKALQRMRHTCQVCGKPGRVRSGTGGQFVTRCAGCEATQVFYDQLTQVFCEYEDEHGSLKPVWHEHELPDLIRATLHSHLWRQTELPGRGSLRYIAGSDLTDVMPWLFKLSALLKQRTHARSASATQGLWREEESSNETARR